MIKTSSKLTQQLHDGDLNPSGKCHQNKAFLSPLQSDELVYGSQAANAMHKCNADPLKPLCKFRQG